MLLAEEGREVKAYLDMHRTTSTGVAGRDEALTLAKESAEHATTLNAIAGRSGEPWHRTGAGGFLRNVVYGFNDGLTANFGLVAGVLGATVERRDYHHVIVAGVAGLIADALSMGSSGYLAAQSEREVYAHEIAMERDEIALMPEIERDELALIYEAKGMDRESAHRIATQVMADPEKMLAEQVQEELGISESATSPFREGVDHRARHGGRRADPRAAVLLPRRTHRGHRVVRDRRCSRTGSSARRAPCSPDAACSAPGWTCSSSDSAWRSSATTLGNGSRGCSSRTLGPGLSHHPHEISFLRSRSSRCSSLAASPLAAQVSGPAAGAHGQPVQYYPLYGATLGIAIPAGRLGDEHAAGYHIGGLVEFAVPNQPYALRGEAMYRALRAQVGQGGQRRERLRVRSDDRLPVSAHAATSTFLTGGIAIYHATTEKITVGTTTVERGGGTRPGFNVGTGIAFPLTDFSALAEIRLHVMLGGEQADPDAADVGGGEVLSAVAEW